MRCLQTLYVGLALLGSLQLLGCVREDLDDCPPDTDRGVRLHLSYTLNQERTDLFEVEVDGLHLHVYDDAGVLVLSRSVEPDELLNGDLCPLDLPAGDYTAVVLGGYDPQQGHFCSCDDRLAELRFGLQHEQDTVPARTEHLFHGEVSFSALGTDASQQVELPLIKNTHDVHVVVLNARQDAEESSTDPLDMPGTIPSIVPEGYAVSIMGSNCEYDCHDNPLHETTAYEPYYGINTGWTEPGFTAHFRTGRLLLGDDTRVTVRRGDDVLYDAPLSQTLASNAGFTTNEELDRYDDYTLVVRLGSEGSDGVLAEIWIEDWRLVIQDGGGI